MASNLSNITEPGPVMEFLGRVAYEAQLMRPLAPTYAHLLISAVFPIYVAAHASLARPPSAKPRPRTKGDDSDDESNQKIESLTPSDAILFPLLAGATLATLYFILKWLQDPAWLNWALGMYFSQIGLFFATKFLKDIMILLRSVTMPTEYSASGKIWKADLKERCFTTSKGQSTPSPLPAMLRFIPLPAMVRGLIWNMRRLVYTKAQLKFHIHRLVTIKAPITILDLAALIISSGVVYYHTFISKPWFLTNFLGFSFCYGSLQFISPTTAWTGTLILSALFCYDIYFVFFTPMMVTVATKLDVPIKLLFPRPDGCILPVGAAEGSTAMEEYLQCLAKKRTMAMLGLGDIVVPGMMLAFALRFDLYLYYLKQGGTSKASKPTYRVATGSWGERFWTKSRLQSDDLKAKRFPKSYFSATIIGYLVGMVTTVIVMQTTGHAQPALLYLVPGVLISLWGTALLKGDLQMLWNYTEASEEDQESKAKKDQLQQKTATKEIEANGTLHANEISIKVEDTDEPTRSGKDGRNEEIELNRKPHALIDNEGENSSKEGKRKEDSEKSCRRLVYLAITLPKSASANKGQKSKPKVRASKESVSISDTDTGSDSTSSSGARLPPTSPKTNESSTTPTHQYELRSRAATPPSPIPDVKADHAVFAKLEKEAREAKKHEHDTSVKAEEPPGKRRRKA